MPAPGHCPLSFATRRRLETLFRAPDREEATQLLVEGCGNNLPLSGHSDEFQLERVRFAALKLSGGVLSRLREAVRLAQTDARDLLVAAGFGDDVRAHEDWFPG